MQCQFDCHVNSHILNPSSALFKPLFEHNRKLGFAMWSGDKLILTPDLKFLPNSRKGDYENGFTFLYSSIGICVSISRQGNITWLIVRLNITPFNGRSFLVFSVFFFFI